MVCILIHVRLLEFPLGVSVFLLENFLFHFQGNGILWVLPLKYSFVVSDITFNFTIAGQINHCAVGKKKIGRKAEYVKDSCFSSQGDFPTGAALFYSASG